MDVKLHGLPKAMKAILQEQESVWDQLMDRCKGKAPIGKCKHCMKSKVKKDAERWVAAVEAMGQEDMAVEEDLARSQEPENIELMNDWCCMSRILSLQEDFAQEKSMLQHYIEGRGHICMFLPKFHCELNPIEMVWGFMKYCK